MRQKKLNIVPKPKSIRFRTGEYRVPSKVKIKLSDKAFNELKAIKKIFAKYGIKIDCIEKINCNFAWVSISGSKDFVLPKGKKPNGKEGYVLLITKNAMGIWANTNRGLFWALQTLAQMLEDSKRLPAVRIDDYPDIKMRGIHFDFKGTFSNEKHLLEMVEKLAYYKINTLLVEYEDKIAYTKNKKIALPHALSKDQVKKFVRHCREQHIEVIPLMQSFGHVEYILKHPTYKKLREDGYYDQLCPCNPESLKLFKECAGELIALHPDTEWFHIGADETRRLGYCPDCKKKADRIGKAGLFVEYIAKVIQIIQKMGKKPILWDDMLTRSGHPELFNKLPKNVTLMYWNYVVREKEESGVNVSGFIASKQWLTKSVDKELWQKAPDFFHSLLENGLTPEREHVYNVYKKHVITKNSPMFFYSLPHLKLLKGKRIETIGAASCRLSSRRFIDVEGRIGNIGFWAKTAKENNLVGVVSTSWARTTSVGAPSVLTEDTWYPMIASGEFYWSADTEIRDFDRRFNHRFLGIADTSATDLQYTFNKCRGNLYSSMTHATVKEFSTMINKAKRNQRYLEYIYYLMRVENMNRNLQYLWLNREGGMYTHLGSVVKMPLSAKFRFNLPQAKKVMKGHLREMSRLRREGVKLYRQTIFECEAHERVETLIRPIEAFYECIIKELERAVKMYRQVKKNE